MSGFAFRAGMTVWLDGRPVRIAAASDPRAAEVVLATGERQTVDLLAHYAAGALHVEAPAVVTTPNDATDLTRYNDAEWAEARRREAIVAPLMEGHDVARRVAEAARAAGVTSRTLYRWMHQFERGGVRGLVPAHRQRGGAGKPRVSKDREALLVEVLGRVYLKRTRPTIKHAFEQIQLTFNDKGLPAPSFSTVCRRIRSLDASDVTLAREGGAKSRSRHMVSRGSFPVPSSPLHTILIDHTPLDLHLVDSQDRTRVIGRPFLTLAMDACTRMVFGYFLTLDPPSYLSVAMVLLQGAMPKDEALARYDLKVPWPIYGLPSVVYTDNGKEFRSKHLERFAEGYQIELHFRPVKVPHYGGLIERVIGTVNRYVHPLEGTAKSSVRERGDYDAERYAYLTLEEADEHILRRIVEHYHTEVHSELGRSPLAAWEDAVRGGRVAPSLPPDPERFRIDLLPYEERTIQKDGVALFDLNYTDGVLRSLRGRERRGQKPAKHVVKYDPRDLSRVYVIPADGGPVHAVPLSDRAAGSFSLLELRRSKELAKAEKRPWSGRNLCDMLARERASLAEAAEKTRRAKRTAARVANQHAAAPAAPKGSLRVVEAPPDEQALEIDGDGWETPVLHYRSGS